MKTCPTCGTSNRDSAKFCQNCAAPLVSELLCPNCGTSNPPNAKFCLNCAATLRGQTPAAGLTGALPVNAVLGGRYTMMQKLGRGGMGAVYLVNDARLAGKQWAAKEMSDAALTDPAEKQKAVAAFQHEATLLASLNHPNLTKVVDYFEDKGKHYLIMDFVDGRTLEDMLDARSTPFPESQALGWADQLCDVLGYLHGQNPSIIFRDLKPGNIMLDRSGRLRLIDFGVARLFKPGKSRDTANFGTAGYAPPEQYGKGQTDARSDVYALGATLHQMLTLRDPGDEPFKFPPVTSLNSKVSPPVNAAVMKAVQLEPNNRWPDTAEMARALKAQAPAPAPIPQPVAPPPIPMPVAPAVAPAPVYRPAPVQPQAAQKPVSPQPVIRRSGFWGYVLIVAILGIGSGFILRLGFIQWGTPWGNLFGATLIAIPPLLAALLTKRFGAAALTWIVMSIATGGGANPSFFVALSIGYELPFLVTRYSQYTFVVLLMSALLSDAANYLVLTMSYGYRIPFSDEIYYLLAGVISALAVRTIGGWLKRV